MCERFINVVNELDRCISGGDSGVNPLMERPNISLSAD